MKIFSKHKIYLIKSALFVLGCSFDSFNCIIFIASWIQDELNYDTFNSKADRIVRIVSKSTTPLETFTQAVTAPPLAKALKTDFHEVENYVRFIEKGAIVKSGGLQSDEDGILITDPSFFDIFDFHLLKGNIKTALKVPYSIVLTKSMAEKYFGNRKPKLVTDSPTTPFTHPAIQPIKRPMTQ